MNRELVNLGQEYAAVLKPPEKPLPRRDAIVSRRIS